MWQNEMRMRKAAEEELHFTGAEEDQAGPQCLQLNLWLEVVDLHGAEDLTHGHVQLIQTGRPSHSTKTYFITKQNMSFGVRYVSFSGEEVCCLARLLCLYSFA